MSGVKVSVICTNYNKGPWIGEAIESFLAQKTKFNFEIIVVDDKSTDGSQKIIEDFAAKYPEKIRAFYNEKNLGITKTWKKICKEAKGKYIARCDGDDYWIDENKLQMQVEALEKNKKSAWSTTDYNVINADGEVTDYAAVESGVNNLPRSYEEMLVRKGMTGSSTWLVDAKLMQEINRDLDDDAVDDTFNIQLDLFNKTELTYIPRPTAVYRANEGSDSRPTDEKVVRQRDERLLKSQLEYIDKYKNVKYREIIELAFIKNMEDNEMHRVADDRLRLIGEFQRDQREKEKLIDQKQREIDKILSSKRYKLGGVVVAPVAMLRKLIKKKG